MNLNQIKLKQFFLTVIICGLIGGALLILTALLPIKGYWSILIYAIVMIGTIFVVKLNEQIEINYIKTLLIGFIVFLMMSYVRYFYIEFFRHPNRVTPIWGHTWRFIAVIGFALISGSILGLFFMKRTTKLKQKL